MAFDFKAYCNLLNTYTMGMNTTLNDTLEYELAFAVAYMRNNNISNVQLGGYMTHLLSVTGKFDMSTDYPYLDLLAARYTSLDNLDIEYSKKTRIVMKIAMYVLINLVLLLMLYCFCHLRIYTASIIVAGVMVYDIFGVFLNITDFCVPPLREFIRRKFEMLLFTYHRQPWYRSREAWVLLLADKLRNYDLSDSDKLQYENFIAASKNHRGKSRVFALAGLELLWMKYSVTA